MLQDKKLKSVAEAVAKIMGEDLKGKQHKIDANHNNKIDAEDFKILRGEKKMKKEEVEQIDEVKLADLPVRKVSGTKYGGESQKDEPEEDDEDMDDKPKKSVKKGTFKRRYNTKAYKESFTGMMTNLQEQGLGYVAELMVTEEPTNDEYTAEVKDAQAKSEGKGKKAEVAKPLVQAVKNEEVEQLDELGNTPAGKAALHAVQSRADKTLDSWDQNPKSGYSPTPKKVQKAHSASLRAGNRLHGFGPSPSNKNTVMARSAFNATQNQNEEVESIEEDVEQIDELSKNLVSRYQSGAKFDMYSRGFDDAKIGHEHNKVKHLLANKHGGKDNPLSKTNAPHIHKALSKVSDEIQKMRQAGQDKIKKRASGIHLATAKLGGAGKKGIAVPATGKLTKAGKADKNPAFKSVTGYYEEVEQIEERTLSPKEVEKKEEYAKSMKKKMGEFRKRYGKRAKNVMYATATEKAKGSK